MLASTLGVRLILWIGKTIPTPAPYPLTSAITRVSVQTDEGAEGDGFQITFTVGKFYPDYTLLQDGSLDPSTRVVIGVLLGAKPYVLMDGIITNHQLSPSTGEGTATLTVSGKDISAKLDMDEQNTVHPDKTDQQCVGELLKDYRDIIPLLYLGPTTYRWPEPNWMRGTVLRCVREMAWRNNYVFFVEPVSFLLNRAYFGPKFQGQSVLAPLTVDMGAATNVTSLSFSQEAWFSGAAVVTYGQPEAGEATAFRPLPSSPLASQPTEGLRTTRLRYARMSPAEALSIAQSFMTNQPDPVTGSGEVDSVRYGGVLRARQSVAVRGAGRSYDGMYYLRSVTHNIERGKYTQSFSISREGTGNLMPKVLPPRF